MVYQAGPSWVSRPVSLARSSRPVRCPSVFALQLRQRVVANFAHHLQNPHIYRALKQVQQSDDW